MEIDGDEVYLDVDIDALKQPTDSVRKEPVKGQPHTVFVGGSPVALNAVQEMRRRGYKGAITVLTA